MQFCSKDLKNIPYLGEKAEAALKRLNINSTFDLLFHFPKHVTSKRMYPALYSLRQGDQVVLRLKIIDISQPNISPRTPRKPFTIFCSNETGMINLTYFGFYPQYLLNWAKIGSEIIAIGKIDIHNKLTQIAHPEILNPLKANIKMIDKEIIYPLTYGIVSNQLHKYISFILDLLKIDEEWIAQETLQKNNWLGFKEALKKIHNPKNKSDISPYSLERQRIAYDELLATQLMVNLLRQYKDKNQGRSITTLGSLTNEFIKNLPFELTNGQKDAIDEIIEDQASNKQMSRLLQGDVGSGKTVVSIAAMLNTTQSGAQAVLMAPTDVLANQHYQTLEKFCSNLPVKFALLTGKTKAKERREIMEGLQSGEIHILIGTHAVFQEKVSFNDLALVVIDEQHRFGVEQRLSLVNKGNKADLLIMSATPIPRSLSLALYGDMDITRISEKPKSRIGIKTSILPQAKVSEVILSLNNILKDQGRIYWVCPLISKDEDNTDLQKMPAESRKEELSKYYPGLVEIIHGQLEPHNKQKALDNFIQGKHKILVATTVIEVGVDVPEATVMIIENAESFGLSQLHQLRGRVGRGNKASHCILLYQAPISKTSWQRLKIIRESEDGFILAEEDLKLRGSGDLIGTKQSGLPDFKAVDFIAHHHLIIDANKQAKNILKDDPYLNSPKNQKYRDLLNVFGFNRSDLINLA
ncbi:MAG: ATP-dependent DNA helicase RecG [Pseudomonadota bacterium]